MLGASVENMKLLSEEYPVCIWDADAVFNRTVTNDSGVVTIDSRRVDGWDARIEFTSLIFTTVLGVVDQYRDRVRKILWVPQFYDAEFFKPAVGRLSGNEIYDVCFVGNSSYSPSRSKWLIRLNRVLAEQGKTLKVVGRMSGFISNPLTGRELATVIASSRIVIDLQRPEVPENMFWFSNRVFITMGCGAFFLGFAMPQWEKLFKVGYHFDVYDNTYEDFEEKIFYWLDHEKKREVIAKRGHKEVMDKHTLAIRVPQYLDYIRGILC
jgi:hypothetical protein